MQLKIFVKKGALLTIRKTSLKLERMLILKPLIKLKCLSNWEHFAITIISIVSCPERQKLFGFFDVPVFVFNAEIVKYSLSENYRSELIVQPLENVLWRGFHEVFCDHGRKCSPSTRTSNLYFDRPLRAAIRNVALSHLDKLRNGLSLSREDGKFMPPKVYWINQENILWSFYCFGAWTNNADVKQQKSEKNEKSKLLLTTSWRNRLQALKKALFLQLLIPSVF